jgi:hypothetical protein
MVLTIYSLIRGQRSNKWALQNFTLKTEANGSSKTLVNLSNCGTQVSEGNITFEFLTREKQHMRTRLSINPKVKSRLNLRFYLMKDIQIYFYSSIMNKIAIKHNYIYVLLTNEPHNSYCCCCGFDGGAYQHCSHEGLLYSNPPNGVPSFISRGAAHQTA